MTDQQQPPQPEPRTPGQQQPGEPDPAADPQPQPASASGGEGGREGERRDLLPWLRRTFTSTTLLVPLVLLLLGAMFQPVIADGYGWTKNLFKDEEPPLYVSPSRKPRTLNPPDPSASTPTPDPARSGTPSGTGTPSPSPSPSATKDEKAPGDGGSRPPDAPGSPVPDIAQGTRSGESCPWDRWVVRTPPSELTAPPVVNGSPRLSYKDAADPDETHVRLSIQPRDNRPLTIENVRIKIIKRNPAPGPRHASLVALKGCPQEAPPHAVEGRAGLDGGGPSASVRTVGPQGFPQELKDAQTLHVHLAVEASTCDCTWVPVVEFTLNGRPHKEEVRSDGEAFRTIPSQGYQRFAWEERWEPGENGTMTRKWVRVRYPE